MAYQIGDRVHGKVTGVQPYGAFVTLGDETQGLIHISEIKHGFVSDINEYVKVGDELDVIILDIDEYSKQMSLSLRALQETDSHPFSNRRRIRRYGRRTDKGFESIRQCMPGWIDETLDNLSKKSMD